MRVFCGIGGKGEHKIRPYSQKRPPQKFFPVCRGSAFFGVHPKRVTTLLVVAALVLLLQPAVRASEQYLLRQPVSDALEAGKFSSFIQVCQEKISVNFGAPFELSGYINRDKFIEDFSSLFSGYRTQKIEWASQQIEIPFAVQSINLILKNKRSDKTVYYKFILFMIKKDQKWKIYHCRGLSF